jgi:hypothetical protein
MDNFDLKKFLVENKLTKNAKLLSEYNDESLSDNIEGEQNEEFFIELEDYLINKALDVKDITFDEKNDWPKIHLKLTFRVETPGLDYSLVLSTTFLAIKGEDRGFQGDYVSLSNFDIKDPKWEEYEDELNSLEDVDIDSLNNKAQNALEETFEDLKQNWYEDYFDN